MPPDSQPDRSRGNSGRAGRGQGPSPMGMVGSGFEFAGVVVLLTLGGWWLDGKWGTSPWLMLAGLFVGTVGGTYRLYLEGKRFFRE